MGLWGKLKGVLYLGAIAAPGAVAFNQLGGTKNSVKAAQGTIMAYAFMDPNGKFNYASGAQMWMPVAAVAAIDYVTGPSMLNVQKKISSGLRQLKGK